jgi:hypothetical protein
MHLQQKLLAKYHTGHLLFMLLVILTQVVFYCQQNFIIFVCTGIIQ